MYRFADEHLTEKVKLLWQACFGDPPGYIDLLFQKLIRPENVLCELEGDTLRAMLCIEPVTITAPGDISFSAAYIYAVATHPDHQGLGLSTALMNEAHLRLMEQGVHLSMLVPASESLFTFYGNRGYETWFHLNRVTLAADDFPSGDKTCVLTPSALHSLAKLRDKAFADSRFYVRWNQSWLAGIDAECRYLGGEILRISCAGTEGYAVCYRWENTVYIKELALPGDEQATGSALRALHQRYGAAKYVLYLRTDRDAGSVKTVLPFAMVRWYDRERRGQALDLSGSAPWITHVLD